MLVRRLSGLVSFAVLGLALGGLACEQDTLFNNPPPDAGQPDAELPDAEAPDLAFPDAQPPPDRGPPDTGIEPAREAVYAHTGDTLYSFDPVTRAVTVISGFRTRSAGITNMVDIAIDRRGRLYGGTLDQKIYTIDPASGACTYLFDVDDRPNGLAVLPDGRLVVAGDRVSVVDPNNGQVIETLVGEGREKTSGDLVGLPDGQLYWTVRGTASEGDVLVRLDPRTRRVERLGATNTTRIFGLGYADDVLYGFSADGVAIELDPATGAVQRRATLDGRWYGATSNPVLWR